MLGFTLKVANHLGQKAWSNRLNENQPASTSTTQNVYSVKETLVYCTDIVYLLAMTIYTYIFQNPSDNYLSLQKWQFFRGRQCLSEILYKGVLWKITPPPFFFLLSTLSYSPLRKGNLTLVSVTNLVWQDFSHTLHKRPTPLQSTYFRFTSRLSDLQPGNWAQNTIWKSLLLIT